MEPALKPHSGERPKCPKCANVSITHNKWQPDENALLRRCMSCDYSWKELPADAGGA